jgi:exopolysaccharide biosynthesis polyprenyl glycosylphosphotransferase
MYQPKINQVPEEFFETDVPVLVTALGKSHDFPVVEAASKTRKRFEAVASFFERTADMASVMAASMLAYSTYQQLEIGKHLHYTAGSVILVALAFAVFFVWMLDNDGAYKPANSLLGIRETERILRVSTRAFGVVFLITFFFSHLFSRWVVVLAVVFIPLLLVIEKQFVFFLIRHLHNRGYGLRNVLVYGAGFTGRRVFSALVRSPKLGLNPVAFVDDNEGLSGREVYEFSYKRERSAPVIAGPLTSDVIREWGASLVVVAIPSLSLQRIQEIAAEAFAAEANVAFVPELSFDAEAPPNYVDIDGLLIASLDQAVRKRGYEMTKRIFDFAAAFALLAFTAPLWAVLAIFIRQDSKGPVFFRQLRVGRGGKPFELYKFRSMRTDAPKYGIHPAGSDDPRVTPVGRWIRRTSVDELPQLINILKGEMSLVGPRPEMPFVVKGYNTTQRQRLSVLPGLTGLWQLSADRAFLIHENIQYDLYYIRHRNFFVDLAILMHTGIFVMKGV